MNDDQLATMHGMLAMCLSPDNAARAQAEASITAHLNEHREPFLVGLTKLLRSSPEPGVRVLSAIILRQTLPQGDTVLFRKLPAALQTGIQSELLQAIVSEPDRYVRSQISDTVASLASVLIYDNSWPGLFEGLYAMCAPTQPNDALKVCALDILGKLSDAADNLLPQVAALHSVFAATLAAPNSLLVRCASTVAACQIVLILEEPAHTKEYQKFVPLFLQVLSDALGARDEDRAKQVLQALTQVASEEGKFFAKDLNALVPLMYAIGVDANRMQLDDGVRQYACEVLLGIAENAPVMVRKNPAFIKHTLLICMSLMLDVEEDANWGVKNDSLDFYDNSNFDCGEFGMDRISNAVKGDKLWKLLQPILHAHVSNNESWLHRHAGLFGLAQASGELPFEVLPVKEVVGFLRDPHPRVRFAAVQCLGMFPMEFPTITQTKHHKIIFPGLIDALGDVQNPRLQAHVASALLNIVDGCPAMIVKIYCDRLMTVLVALLKQGHQMVQIQVMPTMAAVAGELPKAFADRWYDVVVPLMVFIIQNAVGKDTRLLRAKAMEAVSYIGMYVGPAKFHNDARNIVNLFLGIMEKAHTAAQRKAAMGVAAGGGDGGDDEYSEQHMLQAWTRICSCLKAEFVPILPFVMPIAFEAITRNAAPDGRVHKIDDDSGPGVELEDDGEEEDSHVTKDGRVKSLSALAQAAGASQVAPDRPGLAWNNHAHTAALEEKANAMIMICAFAHDLLEHFMPYVRQTSLLFIPMLDDYNEDIQGAAIEMMPLLLKSAVEGHKKGMAGIEFVKALFEAISVQMIQSFRNQGDAQILQLMIVSLQDCIDIAGPIVREVIDDKMLYAIGEAILKLLTKSHERIAKREEILKREEVEGDMDEERIVEIETRNAGEDGLNTRAADCIQTLIKSHREQFLPVFDRLYGEIQRMLSINSLDSTKKIAVFIIDDVFEHLGPAAAKYFPALETMCIYASDLNGEHGLRQAAAYGVSMAARHGGPAFMPFRDEIARRFVVAIQSDPDYLKREPCQFVGRQWQPVDENDEGAPRDTSEGADEGETTAEEEDEEEEEEEELDDGVEEDDRSRYSALDNIVSALGSIALYQNAPEVYAAWLSFLPLRVDDSEGATVYGQLLDLIDANSPLVLGENFANLPKILHIFLSLVNTNFLKNKELRARVGKFFHNVKAMPPALLQQVVPHLPQEFQAKLGVILQAIG